MDVPSPQKTADLLVGQPASLELSPQHMSSEPSGKLPSARAGAVAQVAETLREMIVVGRLWPGATLVERTFARRLSVSRSTLRSALHVLEREGYVVAEEAGKYSRATVAPLTVEDMQELHEVLAALNGMAARRAAALDADSRNALADELEEVNRALRRVTEGDDAEFPNLHAADARFHAICMEAAASRRLQLLYDVIAPQAERYGRMYAVAVVGKGSVSADEHARIIEAVRAGDKDAAELAVVRNFLNAAERFRAAIDGLNQAGRR